MDVEKLIERLKNYSIKDKALLNLQTVKDAAEALEKLQAELEKVKAEKAAAIENLSENLKAAFQLKDAAVADVCAIIGDVEEIRRGYGVDNADADKAFADLCGRYCANEDCCCYEEGEHYHCKHFKWRGLKEEWAWNG